MRSHAGGLQYWDQHQPLFGRTLLEPIIMKHVKPRRPIGWLSELEAIDQERNRLEGEPTGNIGRHACEQRDLGLVIRAHVRRG